jgi:hypothetical protein
MHKPESDKPILRVIEPNYEVELVEPMPAFVAPLPSQTFKGLFITGPIKLIRHGLRRAFRRIFCLDAYWETHTPESSSWGRLHVEAGTGEPDE